MSLPNINGNFVYRSLLNSTFIGEDFLKLKFGEGLMTLTQKGDGDFTGNFDMGDNYLMTLEGTIYEDGNTTGFKMRAIGVDTSPTKGWIYDYQGIVVPDWPNGINQLLTVVGSVIRVVDHGTSKAGVTATFYMVSRD
ncbi:hypothetical protein [Flavobacterium sp.]|uniref:hypothetical protein n=1 Tax=Flavobacterium sp. TaxID=239 RepID=UPI003D6C3F5E